MADSNFRGPVNSMGSLEVDAATASIYPTDGPGIFYQGTVLPDPRTAPFPKDGFRPGQQLAFINGAQVLTIDTVPQARGTSNIAVATTAAAPVTVALATVGAAGVASAANIAVGVPIVPIGTTVATNVIALDFGFTTGSTVVNSTTVQVIDNTLFHLGQWIILGNVGNSSLTRSLVAQVAAISTSNTTTININVVAQTTLINIPIGQGNLFGSGLLPTGTVFGPNTASASGHSFGGAITAGLARVMNPRETSARTITMNGTTAGGAVPLTCSAVISGWDLWGNPMTEIISASAATSTQGKKAFKYIGSITLGTTSATAAAFGLGECVGYPLRSDEWDITAVTFANTAPTNNNGYIPSVISAANGTSGDVRGLIMLGTAVLTGSGITTSFLTTAMNGTSRLTVIQTLTAWQQVMATPLNPVPMFGVAQNTAIT